MPVIKRYANRKLYDTDSKRYVTLEDLAEFIRRGEDVRVVDHVTGEDLTSVTLLQVIFEEEKKMGVLFPQVLLTRMIRLGGETVSTLRGRLAAMDPFQIVDEEIRRRIKSLVEQGRLAEDEAGRIQELLLRRVPLAEGTRIPVQGEAPNGAESSNAPVADTPPGAEPADPQEVDALRRQVDQLESLLQQLKNPGPQTPSSDEGVTL